jgi:predicted ArsR family transcriptional regulator
MAMKTLTPEQKKALATMRERMGGISEEKKQHAKQFKTTRKAIEKMLADKPATVPQIATALNIPSDEALWHLTGMRKYGQVSEAGEDGDYFLYALVAGEGKSAAGH